MTEPDVALTDWALAVECAALGWRTGRLGGPPGLRAWLTLFFAATGLAALLGGAWHGFFTGGGPAADALWRATMLCIGAAAWALWAAGAHVQDGARARRPVIAAAALAVAAYASLVLGGRDHFGLALAVYLPAAGWLAAVFWGAHRRSGAPWARTGLLALGLTAGAAALEVGAWHAAYHVVQGVALLVLFVAMRGRLAAGAEAAGGLAPQLSRPRRS